ncbi:MAG: high frequency lysogenization protein HflD [Candidatus Polarisedimenticolaceae bacterium]|nr:high frequency lysogenization protein HflD [Candidatus Polarisedimenticolaceae bacterium]
MNTDQDQIIALAGIFQAACLTDQIAHNGIADASAMNASIYSLFQIDAESVNAVYGGMENIRIGLQKLDQEMEAVNLQNAEIARYVLALMHLEQKLRKNPAMLKQIADAISQATGKLNHFPMLHSNIIALLADVYTSTISTLHPRIMVNGEPAHLQNIDNANKIRALLLAGVRSAMLWRQCGGSRMKLLISRRKIIGQAKQLLKTMPHREQNAP